VPKTAKMIAEIIAITLILTAVWMLILVGVTAVQEYGEDESALRESVAIREMARMDASGNTVASHNPYEAAAEAMPGEEARQDHIHWAALNAANSDTIGWISLESSGIDYPIVQGIDNEHYLHNTFLGERNVSGAIFLDYRDNSDFTENVRIYGHNMRNGTKFGSLSAWEGNTITIYTPRGKVLYSSTWRGALPLSDVMQIDSDLALITCVRGQPEIRYVVLAERTGDD